MTPVGHHERGTAELLRLSSRLELIERRSGKLEAEFRRLATQVRRSHDAGQPAGETLLQMDRLSRLMDRGEVEALRLVLALHTEVTGEPVRG